MSFIPSGKVHTHIKELADGQKEFRRGKKPSGLRRCYLLKLYEANIEYSVLATQTGRSFGASSGSRRYYISVNSSDYEKVARIIKRMEKQSYEASMENHRILKNAYLSEQERLEGCL